MGRRHSERQCRAPSLRGAAECVLAAYGEVRFARHSLLKPLSWSVCYRNRRWLAVSEALAANWSVIYALSAIVRLPLHSDPGSAGGAAPLALLIFCLQQPNCRSRLPTSC